MAQFFAGPTTWHGPAFQLFGPAHIAALGALDALNLLLLRFRGTPEGTRHKVRWTLALVIWLAEASWHAWNYFTGQWNIQTLLPLQLCSILIWLTGFMLIFRSQTIYEFAYLLGLGAADEYLLNPDLGMYGFPHYRFFEAFLSHGLLATCAIYMTVVEGFRPTWKSLLRVVIVINLYMVGIFFLNRAIGSDYLFVNAKPAIPSLIDLMPPWPYYILYMELLGLVTCLLLYLPFFIKDRRRAAARVV